MDLEERRKEIKNQHFAPGGLLIISILGIIGIILVTLFTIININELYEAFAQNGVIVVIGIFFFVLALICWNAYFMNVVINPKYEILYLYKNVKNDIYFINKKGKKFKYDNSGLNVGSHYKVLKTRDYIYCVIEKCKGNFLPKEKKSYWLNFYSPAGNFEDIFLLPIVYVIMLPGLISIFMSKGFDKIYGLMICAVPLYIIGYDLIYKIKLKQSDGNSINEEKFHKSYEYLILFISLIVIGITCIVITNLFFRLSDLKSMIIFSPFLGCTLCCAGEFVAKIFKNYTLADIFKKGCIIIFLIFIFCFIAFWTVGIIKQEGSYIYALFSIPFWLAGIAIAYKYLIKK